MGVPQTLVLDSLLFLIYITLRLTCCYKIFADDTSLFSIADDNNVFLSKLNNDLIKIKQLTYQWKISFNPDRTGSADEVILS